VVMIAVTIVHDASDSVLGSSVPAESPTVGGPTLALPRASGALSSDWVDCCSVTGSQSWTFNVPVPAGLASAFLPPSSGNPWTLVVHEGGSMTRSGRVTDFRIIWNSPSGDQTFVADPVPPQAVGGPGTPGTNPSRT